MSNPSNFTKNSTLWKPENNIANCIDYYIYDILIQGITYIGLMLINKMNSRDANIKTEVINKNGLKQEKLVKIDVMTLKQKN